MAVEERLICKAFARTPGGRAALDDIVMKLVRINKDLDWWIEEYATVAILHVRIVLTHHLKPETSRPWTP